ncbi:hypothetical protein BCR43DRAFT_507391 [Syncephalastrum racemosum]|uniref:Uncharacterized protein n=1 Tax=Syncephalastrum racemosum TaxID=13706 RepID=A0A1X2H6V3_SYNRA|nr:hypothetical protein BCR43DRAFT_507391 [Syncephalastrum racemosum]
MRLSSSAYLLLIAFVLQITGILGTITEPPSTNGAPTDVQLASGGSHYSPEDFAKIHSQFAEAAENMRVIAEKSRTNSVHPEDTEAYIRSLDTLAGHFHKQAPKSDIKNSIMTKGFELAKRYMFQCIRDRTAPYHAREL